MGQFGGPEAGRPGRPRLQAPADGPQCLNALQNQGDGRAVHHAEHEGARRHARRADRPAQVVATVGRRSPIEFGGNGREHDQPKTRRSIMDHGSRGAPHDGLDGDPRPARRSSRPRSREAGAGATARRGAFRITVEPLELALADGAEPLETGMAFAIGPRRPERPDRRAAAPRSGQCPDGGDGERRQGGERWSLAHLRSSERGLVAGAALMRSIQTPPCIPGFARGWRGVSKCNRRRADEDLVSTDQSRRRGKVSPRDPLPVWARGRAHRPCGAPTDVRPRPRVELSGLPSPRERPSTLPVLPTTRRWRRAGSQAPGPPR